MNFTKKASNNNNQIGATAININNSNSSQL